MKAVLALAGALAIGATIVGATSPADPPAAPRADSAAILDRFLRSGVPSLQTYKAYRVLQASTRGGRMAASLEAWTFLEPDGTFRYEVVTERGSGLIRDHVLLGALKAEERSRNQKETGQAELTPANYEFVVDDDIRDGFVTIRLLPRRRSPTLLNGTVTVNHDDGDVVNITGSLSKCPSWWTKRVDIVRKYARIAGVRVPVEMSSRADVRIAGDSTFSMVYEYSMINGRTIEEKPYAPLPREIGGR